jgi:hypothetical protein
MAPDCDQRGVYFTCLQERKKGVGALVKLALGLGVGVVSYRPMVSSGAAHPASPFVP